MTPRFRPLREEDARSVLAWRYPAPYELYNADPSRVDEDARWLADPAQRYYGLWQSGPWQSGAWQSGSRQDGASRDVAERGDEAPELVAFCNLGHDARVAGGAYREGPLDLGGGMRPDLCGAGRGAAFLLAVMDFAWGLEPVSTFRVTVADANPRALRTCGSAGFQPVDRFARPSDGRVFQILERAA